MDIAKQVSIDEKNRNIETNSINQNKIEKKTGSMNKLYKLHFLAYINNSYFTN